MSIRLGDSIIARANMDFSDVTSLLTETNELINNVIENDDTNTTVITDSLSENKDAINTSISKASADIVAALGKTWSTDLTTTNNLLQTEINHLSGILNALAGINGVDLTKTNNMLQSCINLLGNILDKM